MKDNSKLPWVTVLSVIITIGTPFCLWGWSVERRMARLESGQNVVDRVSHLEDALLPVLVEYKLQEELKKIKPADTRPGDVDRIRKSSEKWAHEAIRKSGK